MEEIMASLFFGLVGFAYFRYGRKAADVPMVIAGLILMVFPYFFSGLVAIFCIGTLVSLLPFILKKFLV